MDYPEFDLEKALEGEPIALRLVASSETLRAYVTKSSVALGTYVIETERMDARVFDGIPKGESFQLGLERYVIVGMWRIPLKFDHWEAVHPRWNALAKDQDGFAWFYETSPTAGENIWLMNIGENMGDASVFRHSKEFFECDWKDSLIERPKKGVGG